MPSDRGGVEEYLRAEQRGDACRLRIPLVPADQYADRCVARPPGLEAVRLAGLLAVIVEVPVSGREVVLLIEQRVVRDVHLPVDAEECSVRVDDSGGVA